LREQVKVRSARKNREPPEMWMETEEMNDSFQYHPGPSGREAYRTLLQFKADISRATD
jgi:hypothetical protein